MGCEMFTCTINGISSTNIKGMQILELPPVTKPKMRTLIETIDGRPGDIVTKLGYEAYDKTMVIGLHDNYDEDEVISFFNQDGIITFSNEPNFYYRFQMLAGIDFEKVHYFRKAEITFHVQPYKYAISESPRTFTTSPANIVNIGNVESVPKITIAGSGTVVLIADGNNWMVIDLDTYSPITIDAETMNATSGGNLANRYVQVDYDYITLSPGAHSLVWTVLGGSVTSVTVENYSRWA